MPKENESISLGKIGIVDGGVYDPKKTYNSGTFVLHNGSTWLAMKDSLTGATPEEGTNWKYLARGFASEMLSLITAIDSQGLLGSKGAEVTGQALIDKLADMAANKLIQKASMSNVQANDQNKVPTSALAYAMNRSITQNEEAITQLNRDISDTWGYYMADSFNVDTAGNCILWINTYTESFLGTHPFRDDHYMLISINDNGSRLQVGISMHQGIKSRYAIPGGSWDNWV